MTLRAPTRAGRRAASPSAPPVPRPRAPGGTEAARRCRRCWRGLDGLAADGLEAIQLALVEVRRELEPFGPRLTWTGEPGELGLPLLIPDFFGGEVRRRLEALVQREIEREGRRLKELTVHEPG